MYIQFRCKISNYYSFVQSQLVGILNKTSIFGPFIVGFIRNFVSLQPDSDIADSEI